MTVTTNAITSIQFDYAWENSDTGSPNDNVLEISYAGTLYARFTTGGAGGTTGAWTYFNGASGTDGLGIAAVADVTTGVVATSTNTITLGTPATASGRPDLHFHQWPLRR